MIALTIPEDDHAFDEWREKARRLIQANISPDGVLWDGAEGSLFGNSNAIPEPINSTPFRVSPDFIKAAKFASHHADPSKWGLFYRMLWRQVRKKNRQLLQRVSDPDVVRLRAMEKDLRRDIHKMHAFVRFKKVGEDQASNREQFVAWFEPAHRIMPLTAGFFQKRFTGMDWSIFTPTGSAHWDGKTLQLAPGVPHMEAPDDEELENLWRGYYKSIFNPARLKTKAMQAEMPKKYWKNLPEAGLIEELIRDSRGRVGGMMDTEERPARELRNSYLMKLEQLTLAGEQTVESPENFIGQDLPTLAEAAAACQACPLHENATQTVFGEGPADARIMLVGEQPGDQEDLAGKPFIGPAGKLLTEILAEAGIDREKAYLTNSVKHFKWKPRGKMRLHQTPGVRERKACQPWVLAEIAQVQPEVLICLGSTAAKSLIDPNFKITQQRGLIEAPNLAPKVIATIHPSYLLRIPDKTQVAAERQKFIADLRQATT